MVYGDKDPPPFWIKWQAHTLFPRRVDPDALLAEIGVLPPTQRVDIYFMVRLLVVWLIAPVELRLEMFDRAALAALEERILFRAYDAAIREPLGVIAFRLQADPPVDPDMRLAWACVAAAEWAHNHGFEGLRVAFLHLAARAADTVHFYLVAELAETNALIARADQDTSLDQLRGRAEQLTRMIAARGGLVSLAPPQ